MEPTIRLLDHAPVTFEQARAKDFNVVHRHHQIPMLQKLYDDLWSQRDSLLIAVRTQLGLEHDAKCDLALPVEWIRGKFNLCIPVNVQSSRFRESKIMMRCPMPFALSETFYPGNTEEKLRGEIGAYSWIQQNCPEIRIPHLYGFGISHRHFTHETRLAWYLRISRAVSRWFWSTLQYQTPSPYAAIHVSAELSTSYMLLEYIGPETGQMLSTSWNTHRNDPVRREKLFDGLARIIISLSRIPQPRIGSFCFHDDCTVTLTNRPSFATTTLLENDGAKRSITETYTCTEPFVSDMITLHDNYFDGNESAADEEGDCRGQMAIRAILRTLSHNYVKKEWRNGPFLLQLTDLHQSNIFVNDDWEVTCLLDLEWLCALPPEALFLPHWLTGQDISDLIDDEDEEKKNLTEYNQIRLEFMKAIAEEESRTELVWPLTKIMEEMWQTCGTWFWISLKSVNAAYYLVDDHLCPRYSASLTTRVRDPFSQFWKVDSDQFVAKKIAEFEGYEKKILALFAN